MGFFSTKGIILERIKKTDLRLRSYMFSHYSKPEGFVGRSLCYSIWYDGICYGCIVGGSATKYLPGRNEFFVNIELNSIINNIFFHSEKVEGKYPCREFLPKILSLWRNRVVSDWEYYYHNKVIGFESLVELPRTGECYKRDGWIEVGITHGFTCKRVAGKGTDNWTGKRIWDIDNLRPKKVFVKKWDSSIQV